MSSLAGVYFIAFSANDRLVTISDAVRVWDVASGKEIRAIGSMDPFDGMSMMGGEGGAALSLDGTQLARCVHRKRIRSRSGISAVVARRARSSCRTRRLDYAELSFTADGHLLVSGVSEKRLKLWDVTTKTIERDLGSSHREWNPLKFSRDGRLLAISEGYTINFGTLRPVANCRH